jgi:PAS domain S-box-containing protein
MQEWKGRKDFLLLTDDEEAALKTLQPLMARHVGELVDAFYRHLLGFAETRKLLSDELITTRLMEAQKRYLLSLVTGPYDKEYQEGRLKIGHVHERIGLTPQWYLGAYSLYLNLLRPLIVREFKDRPARLEEVMTALTKVMFLDMQLAIEAYILKSSEKLEFANKQLADLSRNLEQGLARKGKDLAKAEQQVLESGEQFRLSVEASPSGMLMVDAKGTILLVNAQIERQFGYTRQELLGQSVEMLLPNALRDRHREHRAAFFTHPEPRRMGEGRDLFGRHKDGHEVPVEIGLNPIQTVEGLRVLASIVDITERKRIEQQLRHTERLAELGTLASGMAHEIGTPMNVILGRAEYLMRRTQEEKTKQGLETIVTQVERITKIMNQLLTFARRRPLERRPMDLRKTVEDCLEIVQERLGRHKIQVKTAFEDSIPQVLADPDHMSQVLLNLIINALHAMSDGGTLSIGLRKSGDRAVVTVTDTGHGISHQDLQKIFDPFFTTKEVGKGTGLGLTVVHGIIQEHGGTITVESELGRGTTFTITLPVSGESV